MRGSKSVNFVASNWTYMAIISYDAYTPSNCSDCGRRPDIVWGSVLTANISNEGALRRC